MEKLVSIILPIYNVELYMKKCIETIIGQSYKNIEIILVDDGSTDNSGKIADEYLKKDARIKVIHKENGGLSDARNAGMEVATGEYICFIDSDDYIEKNMISEAIALIDTEMADVAIWGFHVDYEDERGKILDSYKIILPKNIINVGSDIEKLQIDMNFLKVLGYAWNKMYNLEFLKKNGFEFEKGLSGMEDTEFNSRVFQKVKKFIIIDKAYNHYIQRKRETLGNKKYDNLLELNIRLCECHNTLLKSWNVKSEEIEKIYLLDYFMISRVQIKNIILDNTKMKEKRAQIERLMKNEKIKMAIESKEHKTIKEIIYSTFVKYHCVVLLKMYYKFLQKSVFN